MTYTGRRITLYDIRNAADTGEPIFALIQLYAEQYAAEMIAKAPVLADYRGALEASGYASGEAQTMDFGNDDCAVCLAARRRDARRG